MPPATQRRRRTRNEVDSEEDERPRQQRRNDRAEDDDDEAEAEDSDNDMDEDAPSAEQSADNLLAKKLVRYALSCDYSRIPIRRDGIKERVLGNQSRAFRRVFALAQQQLQFVWGMEMKELPLREKMSIHEKRKALSSSTNAKVGTGSYILCTVLPPAYRDPNIIPPSRVPSAEAESTYAAFYTLIVSCIWLNGGELSDQKMKRHLTRLNADQNLWTDKTDVVLKKMERHGYVVKRTERPPVGQDGEHTVTWHVGTRAKEEIGLDGVVGIVKEVYGGTSASLEKKLKMSLGIKDLPNTGEEAEAEAEAETQEREPGQERGTAFM